MYTRVHAHARTIVARLIVRLTLLSPVCVFLHLFGPLYRRRTQTHMHTNRQTHTGKTHACTHICAQHTQQTPPPSRQKKKKKKKKKKTHTHTHTRAHARTHTHISTHTHPHTYTHTPQLHRLQGAWGAGVHGLPRHVRSNHVAAGGARHHRNFRLLPLVCVVCVRVYVRVLLGCSCFFFFCGAIMSLLG